MRDAEPAPGRRRPSWSLPGRVAATAAVAMLAALAMAEAAWPAARRNVTRPPTLVRAETSRSAGPLLRMTT